ncbi:DUF2142 domain-containing protein [Leifsonia sp. NPDC058194]|uniref:DUF2142 domain-containing protein n=1 Tax=Leifsonia sp. NPDC058194 TaxID=3346374 RepID=UPI0036DB9A7D
MPRPEDTIRARRIRRLPTFLIAWALTSLIATIWAIGTPLAASPDEPAHFIRAASVARGDILATGPAGQPGRVEVPGVVANTHALTCTAFDDNKPASCQTSAPRPPHGLVAADTSANRYDPLYYALVGWPSLLLDGPAALYAMRIVSGILVSVFVAASVMLIAGWRRRLVPMLGLLVASTPTLLFLSGMVNPNALEVTTMLAAFVAALTLVLHPDRAHPGTAATVLAVSGFVAANARGLSPLWLAVVLISCLFVARPVRIRQVLRTRSVLVAIGVVVAGAVLAVGWTLYSGSLPSPDGTATYPGVGTSPLAGFLVTVGNTFDYGREMVALFGWLDTPAPFIVFFLWSAFIGAGAAASLIALRRRRRVLAIVGMCVFVALPAVVAGLYVTKGGYIWQGRYALPLFVCLVMLVSAMLPPPRSRGRVLVATVATGWWVGQVASFAVALKRYGAGYDASWVQFFRHPLWEPLGGSIGLIALAALAFAATAVVVGIVACWDETTAGPFHTRGRSRDGIKDPVTRPSQRTGTTEISIAADGQV